MKLIVFFRYVCRKFKDIQEIIIRINILLFESLKLFKLNDVLSKRERINKCVIEL